jgi:O-antigen/teichoic acid export membrane protein
MLKFALPYTLYSGIQYIPKQLDVFLVQYFFSTATVGIYNSAKTLFRVFDESINASFGLVYPPAVKLIASGDKKGLKDLMTKAVSFLLVFILIGVVLLESGLSHLIITFFIPKYAMAIGQFNVLLFAAIALPFTLLSTILIAEGKPWLMVLFVSISVTCSLITFYIVGSLASPNLIPLGIVVNASVNGFLCLIYSRKHYGFSYSFVFRAVGDSVNFAKSYINKRKSK